MGTDSQKPLVVIDCSVVMHLIMDLTVDSKTKQVISKLNNKQRDLRLQAGVALYNTLFWIDNIDTSDWEVLWVGDKKIDGEYWRHEYVREWLDGLPEDAPQLIKRKGTRKGYKGNRTTDPYRHWVADRMVKYGEPLYYPGYEADDIAAAVVKSYPDRQIYLATVDSDWCGMVSSKVTWGCLKGFSPNIRGISGIDEWFRDKISKESKRVQSIITSFNPETIWQWKSLVGDASDNLPAGTPIELIDLFNPPEENKLWLYPFFKRDVERKIRKVDTDDSAYIDWVIEYGIPKTKSWDLSPSIDRVDMASLPK